MLQNAMYETMVRYADDVFWGNKNGKSLNSIALLPLLQKLPAHVAASNKTYEGYSVWEIVLHLAYCKYFMRKNLGENTEDYPYNSGIEGFTRPDDPSESNWQQLLEYLAKIHKASMQAVRDISENTAKKLIDGWDLSYEDAAVWLCAHDTYHIAQINNMGVESVRSNKMLF